MDKFKIFSKKAGELLTIQMLDGYGTLEVQGAGGTNIYMNWYNGYESWSNDSDDWIHGGWSNDSGHIIHGDWGRGGGCWVHGGWNHD